MQHVIFFIAIWVVAFSCSSETKSPDQRPNVILINIDDLGYADTELYGNQDFDTPNILRLAAKGMTFMQAYAAAANCAPSRACMLSGQYGPRHGIYTVGSSERGQSRHRKLIPPTNTHTLADSVITLAEEFHQSGYQTITIGKWHLGDDPTTQGFDVNIAGNHSGHPKSYFSPYGNPNLEDGPDGEYLTERLTQEAIQRMSLADTPFFLYLPFYAVHKPLQIKETQVQKYLDRGLEPNTAKYGAMVEHMDAMVGRIMDAVDSLDMQDNIIIFTSDNGGIAALHSQHPLRAGKGSYYEGGIRVPLVFSWPGHIRPGSQSVVPVSNIDIYPTLLALTGQESTAQKQLDGLDLTPVLLGKGQVSDRSLFWHFPIYLQAYDGPLDEARDTLFRTRPGSVMLQGNWKIHHYLENDEWELYNLAVDPRERINLFEQYPKMAQKLQNQLNAWRMNTAADMPQEINPEYEK